jgi:hypothetical protein
LEIFLATVANATQPTVQPSTSSLTARALEPVRVITRRCFGKRSSPPGTGGVARSAGVVAHTPSTGALSGRLFVSDHFFIAAPYRACALRAPVRVPGGEPCSPKEVSLITQTGSKASLRPAGTRFTLHSARSRGLYARVFRVRISVGAGRLAGRFGLRGAGFRQA